MKSVVGADEHEWRGTRRGDSYVTVVIDLSPIRNATGMAQLRDTVPRRSKAVFKTWLAERERSRRAGEWVEAMNGSTGFMTATVEEVP